jgi:predicted RNA binding protein YcfA (HicA-like mRNA interferase family)
MKWSEFEELARMKGWYFYRNGTNHYIYRHPDAKEQLYIERHLGQEIKAGLYRRLMKLIKYYE